MMTPREAKLAEALRINPGVRFSPPDGWYGNAPVYLLDGPMVPWRTANRAWLMDPDGRAYYVAQQQLAGPLSPVPTGPVADRLTPLAWELPPDNSGGPQPDDKVGGWSYGDSITGAQIQFDVRRNGKLTPVVAGTALPPAWALALTNYTWADFDLTTAAVAAPEPAPGVTTVPPSATAPTSDGGTPITGNAADRYLVNGVTYDGLGHVLNVDKTAQPSQALTPAARSGSSSLFPLLLLAGGLYLASRLTHSRR